MQHPTEPRRCCVNRNWPRALPRVGSSPIDRERLWSTKLGHSIEHVARKHRFDSLRCASPTSKSIAENRLVPEERVLDAGLSMIADLLLPSTAPNLADPSDRPIASARPRVASGQLGCLRRRHEALVHDSKLTVNDPNPEASHRPILYDSGRPSSVIWFRMLHATTDSATRPPRDRARSRSPRIDLYRKNAFSTRAWSW